MDRMNPLDASFLHIEDGVNHMHIGSVAVFDGPVPAFDDLRRLFAGKLPVVPRYRQRVRFVPLDLGRPVWADDPHFDLEYHLRHTRLPGDGGEAALTTLVGRLMSQPLDRERPLWEAWMVEGLDDGRWGLVSKVHHCMVDGIAGTDLVSLLLDRDPDAQPLDAVPWTPEPEPSEAELATTALAELVRSPYEQYRALRSGTRAPRELVRRAGEVAGGLRAYVGGMGRPPLSSVDGPIGPHRRWAPARSTLDDIRVVRRGLGGTVNDVVVTAVAQGFRELLLHRGEDPAVVGIRSLVPVSMRSADARNVFDNRVSALVLELPVEVADPVECLHEVRRRMGELKSSHEIDAGGALFAAAELAPAAVVAPAMRLATRAMRALPQWVVNTVITNVPGPQEPLYVAGRRMVEYLPYVPIAQGLRIGVAALSYDGRLDFGVTGDRDHGIDVEVLAAGIEAGMGALVERAVAASAEADAAAAANN